MEDELITIATFVQLQEAYLVKMNLESEGIECFLLDEMLAKVQPFYLTGTSKIRLQVKKEDAPKALEILNKESTETFEDEKEF